MEFLSKIITSVFGINIKPSPGDNPSPVDGDLWYNSTTNKFRKKENGNVSDMDTGGGLTTITGTTVLNFGSEEDTVVNTIANTSINNTNIKTIAFIPIETIETSLDDFKLNALSFNIENIINNTSFDVRGTAANNATGNYTINYIINI